MQGHSTDEQNILSQALVALGQGTGPIRISRKACQAFTDYYAPRIGRRGMTLSWREDGVQALERVRAMGRLAAHTAAVEARTVIREKDIEQAISAVEIRSASPFCEDG